MPPLKLSAKTLETIDYLEVLLKEADHFAALVEQYAAAKKGADMYSSQVSRELSQLRQKAMMRNLGFIADAAGQLSVMASRGGSPMMKARVLRDGVASFRALIERTVKGTIAADEGAQREKAFVHEKEVKAEAEHIRARVIAEEAKEAAKRAAVAPAAAAKPSGAVAAQAAAGKPAGAAAPAQRPAAGTPAAAPKPAGAPRPAAAPSPTAAPKPATAPPPPKPAGAPVTAAARPAEAPAPTAPAIATAAPKPSATPVPSTVNPPAGPRFVGKPRVTQAPAPAGAQPSATRPAATPVTPAKVQNSTPTPSAPAKPGATDPATTKPRE